MNFLIIQQLNKFFKYIFTDKMSLFGYVFVTLPS